MGAIPAALGNVLLWFYCSSVGSGTEGSCEKDNRVEIGDSFGSFWHDALQYSRTHSSEASGWYLLSRGLTFCMPGSEAFSPDWVCLELCASICSVHARFRMCMGSYQLLRLDHPICICLIGNTVQELPTENLLKMAEIGTGPTSCRCPDGISQILMRGDHCALRALSVCMAELSHLRLNSDFGGNA